MCRKALREIFLLHSSDFTHPPLIPSKTLKSPLCFILGFRAGTRLALLTSLLGDCPLSQPVLKEQVLLDSRQYLPPWTCAAIFGG